MTDLMKTQAEWTDFMEVVGAEVKILNALESFWARGEKLRSGVFIEFDQQGIYTSIDLAGQAVLDLNTDAAGFLYVRYTAAGTLTEIFKDSALGAPDLVATGSVAPGSSGTLAEANASGFTAVVVDLPAGAPADDADMRIIVVQDFKRLIEDEYTVTLDVERDKAKTASKSTLQTRVADSLAGIFVNRRTDLLNNLLLTFAATFLQASQTDRSARAGFSYIYVTASGQVTLSDRQGIWAALRQAWVDDTVATPQSVIQSTPTAGNLIAQGGNVGRLRGEGTAAATAIALVMAQNVLNGSLEMRCTNETVGQTRIRLDNTITKPLIVAPNLQGNTSKTVITGRNEVTVDKQYSDGATALTMLARYLLPIESGDTANLFDAAPAPTITSPNGAETDFGQWFMGVERTKEVGVDGSDEFTITFYSNSARTIAVGTVITTAVVGTTDLIITTLRNMVFGFRFNNANADTGMPNKGDTNLVVDFDIDPPKIGDKWNVALTHVFLSAFNEFLARNYLGAVPASGAPTITENPFKFVPNLEG